VPVSEHNGSPLTGSKNVNADEKFACCNVKRPLLQISKEDCVGERRQNYDYVPPTLNFKSRKLGYSRPSPTVWKGRFMDRSVTPEIKVIDNLRKRRDRIVDWVNKQRFKEHENPSKYQRFDNDHDEKTSKKHGSAEPTKDPDPKLE